MSNTYSDRGNAFIDNDYTHPVDQNFISDNFYNEINTNKGEDQNEERIKDD